jgi:hypothetical protein
MYDGIEVLCVYCYHIAFNVHHNFELRLQT